MRSVMKKRILYLNSADGPQRGAAIVEFALVALIFFTLVLGIMEFGRMLYIWNTVQEVTRRAARAAVVGDFNTEVDAIKRSAIFQGGSSGTAYLPAGGEITNLRIQINYLNGSLAPIPANKLPTDPADNISACNDTTRADSCIQFVEACVATTNGDCPTDGTGLITYNPMAGLIGSLLPTMYIPVSSVVMPAESLGLSTSP